ncbi:hypothetical protein CCM_00589 [Cordyceps militaris CM01]|uniref:Uncharacterized protein n=1 Tax=Cordyceps militaris (strain CM01) TaxID=983644 RepID=G3J4W8_CORMM|nr:uncharacterized protein CCM_00589 [Cordyceps militaris CM01]EGX95935.1 hypothetical protein CCM_00589 [Cordyceps militaris CM01]
MPRRKSAVHGRAARADVPQPRSQDCCLPFAAPPPGSPPRTPVPRYLFRVCSPRSAAGGCTTPPQWAVSLSAASGHALSRTDLFRLDDANVAADMVLRHLCWQSSSPAPPPPPAAVVAADNLLSWTSSLLAALVYLFYRRAADELGEVWLCVVDTTRFATGTFIRDADLVGAFCDDRRLGGGGWSRGEYLTQGALGLEGRCAAATACHMLDAGLLELHPRFARMARWSRQDAAAACGGVMAELRRPFYEPRDPPAGRRRVFANDAQIMSRIGDLFGVGWRAPVAVALLSLAPNRTGAGELLLNFGKLGQQWDPITENCLDPTCTAAVNLDNEVPEVAEFIHNLNDAYREFCDARVREHIDDVLQALDAARGLMQLADSVQQPPRDYTTTEQRLRMSRLVQKVKDAVQECRAPRPAEPYR